MPQALAQKLIAIEPRLQGDVHTDPFPLVWMLAVGATYALSHAQPLLASDRADFRKDATALLKEIHEGRIDEEYPSRPWMLGFYLNSAEFRLQAGLHRMLRAYTASNGYAFPIIDQLEKRNGQDRPKAEAMAILRRVRRGFAEDDQPGAALARTWARGNSVKHDPTQNVSDQFGFHSRWNDCLSGANDLVFLLDSLGTQVGAIDPRY